MKYYFSLFYYFSNKNSSLIGIYPKYIIETAFLNFFEYWLTYWPKIPMFPRSKYRAHPCRISLFFNLCNNNIVLALQPFSSAGRLLISFPLLRRHSVSLGIKCGQHIDLTPVVRIIDQYYCCNSKLLKLITMLGGHRSHTLVIISSPRDRSSAASVSASSKLF